MLEHIEPGAGELALLQHPDQRVLVDDVAARRVDHIGRGLQQREAAGGEEMERSGGRGAVDRDDVHAGQHLVEALPVGRLQLVLDLRRDALAVVIVDRQAERLGTAGDGGADAAHADDAEPLTPDAVPEHPGRRPARPFAILAQDIRALDEPTRHGQHQSHGHVRRVLVEDVRRVGDGDALLGGTRDVDIVDAVAVIGDQLQIGSGLLDQRRVDPVGDGGNQHIGLAHRGHELGLRHWPVVDVQARVEKLAHPRFDLIGELAGNDDQGLLAACHGFLES